jgi:hypothetical protein
LENVELIEEKYKLLKEQMVHITKLVEDEKKVKENMTKKQDEEIKNLETRIKKHFQDEREVLTY